jgi:hypothetical protein
MRANLHLNDGVTITMEDKLLTFEEFVSKLFKDKVALLNGTLRRVAINVNRIIWVEEVV